MLWARFVKAGPFAIEKQQNNWRRLEQWVPPYEQITYSPRKLVPVILRLPQGTSLEETNGSPTGHCLAMCAAQTGTEPEASMNPM